MTHLYTYANPAPPKHLQTIAQCLENDGIISYPTDVNWAFGCRATSKKAMQKLQQLKPTHPSHQPFALICDSIKMASEYALIEQFAYRLLQKTLPGPYTYILPSHRSLQKKIDDKRQTVGLRIPECPFIGELITALGYPLLTTSVQIPEEQLNQGVFGFTIVEHFSHLIDILVDLGNEVIIKETTVIDLCTPGEPLLIRQGEGDTSLFAAYW